MTGANANAERFPGRLTADATTFLDIRHVSVRFGLGAHQVHALADIDLRIEAGEFVAVVGPSGCGKSTLMHVLAGFIAPTQGEILLNGKRIKGPGSDRTVVLQQATLFPWLDVYGNVELGPRARGVAPEKRRRDVDYYLDLVGLADSKHRKPYELSGGMQQRVALARALANDADILLVDEPFGALDALTREKMQKEIVRIWHSTGKTILFITHDVEEAVFCSTSIVVMAAQPGRIIDRIPVGFSRLYADRQQTSRGIKASRDYIAVRETVLSKVLGERELED